VFHRMLHKFHSRHNNHHETNTQQTAGAGEHHPASAGGST
jgi:hypothetical protein